jgi:lysophospholipase L1-like esterase
MTTPPVFSAAVGGGTATTITNGRFVNVFSSGTTLNRLFRYPYGDIRQTDVTFPKSTAVSNFAVSNPVSGSSFAGGTYNGAGMAVEFGFDGTTIDIMNLGNGGKYRVLVDEGNGYQYTISNAGNINGTWTADGAGWRRLITFASRMQRNIRYEVESGTFLGVTVGGNDTITPCTRQHLPKCVILGDSFTEPTGADNYFTGWGGVACQILGLEPGTSGSGSTGYVANGTTPRVNFLGRVLWDVINQAPDYVIIAGGINDSAIAPTTIQAAATELYRQIQVALPKAQIYVVGNFYPRAPTTTVLAISDAIKNAALSRSIPFIDTQNGTIYTEDGTQLANPARGSWMTGASGNTSSVQTTGNASIYTGADDTHPVQNGHNYLGACVAGAILEIQRHESRK